MTGSVFNARTPETPAKRQKVEEIIETTQIASFLATDLVEQHHQALRVESKLVAQAKSIRELQEE